MTNPIDTLSRAFVAASAALGEALLAQLAASSPELAAKVAQAVSQGERVVLAFEVDDRAPAIRLMTVDDYQRVKRVLSIEGGRATTH